MSHQLACQAASLNISPYDPVPEEVSVLKPYQAVMSCDIFPIASEFFKALAESLIQPSGPWMPYRRQRQVGLITMEEQRLIQLRLGLCPEGGRTRQALLPLATGKSREDDMQRRNLPFGLAGTRCMRPSMPSIVEPCRGWTPLWQV